MGKICQEKLKISKSIEGRKKKTTHHNVLKKLNILMVK